MAKMIGKKLRVKQCPYECCGDTKDTSSIKAKEKSQWIREAQEELFDKHKNGMCAEGCYECEDIDLDDAYDNSDLDDIPGVWSDVDWRRSLTEADFWFMEEWDDRIANVRKRREIEQAWKEHTQNGNSSSGSVRASG